MLPAMDGSSEITFIIEAMPGGYSAHALGHPISTTAPCPETLRAQVRQAVILHFARSCPGIIRFQLRKLLS